MSEQEINSPQGSGGSEDRPAQPRPRSTNATGRKRRRDTHPGAPSELDCFQVYLELGEERTLPQLAQVLFERYGEAAPSLVTLRRMSCGSHRGGWKGRPWSERLKEHDERVEAKLKEKLAALEASAKFDEVRALKAVVEKTLTTCEAVLSGGKIDPRTGQRITGLALEGSVKEVTELLRTAVEASKHVQLLTGGVTERTERLARSLPGDDEDETSIVQRYLQYAARQKAAGKATVQ